MLQYHYFDCCFLYILFERLNCFYISFHFYSYMMTTTDAASSYFIFFFSIFPCNFRLLMLHRSFAQLNDTRLPVYTTQPLLYRTLVNLKPFIEYNELSFRNYAIPLLVVSLPNCSECSPTVILYQYQSFLSVLFFIKNE